VVQISTITQDKKDNIALAREDDEYKLTIEAMHGE
jgi:hypothetical protein